ncbi:hypothetical protein [Tenacibaculum ovolyticum]|uniref:hypothetical protein n=1 Tax=Tenacibaculum ovolyticum TaxID=104270 RepID=UPI0007EC8A46|nr:hypothetical protein [Tenacibaculum ovolyticum]
MKKSILNLGKALNKTEQKMINGGVTPNSCFDNLPNVSIECREIALNEFNSGGCPTWSSCYTSGPTGCIDLCLHSPISKY